MSALKPTYPTKTNDPGAADANRKFLAEEANELKSVAVNHADLLDQIFLALGITTQTPNLGSFETLQILQAAWPDGADDAYAIIDDGLGSTPQVATYNDGTYLWEVATPDDQIVFVANAAALPGTGIANKLYVALDNGQLFYWNNSQFNTAGGEPATPSSIKYIVHGTNKYRTIKGDGNMATTHEEGDFIDDWTDTNKTEHISGEVLDSSIALPADFSDTDKFFRTGGKTKLV